MISLHSNDVRIRNPKREQLARDTEEWEAVFAENDPSLYIAFSEDGDRIIFWTRSKQRAKEQAGYTPELRIDSFRAVKESLTAQGDEKAHRFAGVEEPKPTPDTRRLCPFRDYAGNEIREGDRIRMNDGSTGNVGFMDHSGWSIFYSDEHTCSYGELSPYTIKRYQAVVVRDGSEVTK